MWVCTWTAAHLDAVVAAADAGSPIFCEKPLGPDLAIARAGRGARSSACRTRSGSCCGSSPVFEHAASIVASGEYGRPLATILRDDQYFPIQGFYGSTWRKDVVARRRRHAHRALDPRHRRVALAARRPGRGERAHRLSRFGHPGIEDTAAVTFAYDDGSVAQLTSVWHQVLTRESGRHLEVFCEGAALWTDDDYLGPLYVQTSDGTREILGEMPEWAGLPDGARGVRQVDRALRRRGEGVPRRAGLAPRSRRLRPAPSRPRGPSGGRRGAGRAPARRRRVPICGRRGRPRTIGCEPPPAALAFPLPGSSRENGGGPGGQRRRCPSPPSARPARSRPTASRRGSTCRSPTKSKRS